MARTCTICSHPKRAEIELSATNGTPLRNIAQQYGAGYTSIARHMAEHISREAKQLHVQRDEAKTLDVLAQLFDINTVTLAILQASKDDPKRHGLALQAVDRIQKQIELQAKLLGDLSEGAQVDIHLDPQWVNMRELIFQALQPFPDARSAVAEAIYQEAQRGRSIA